jgi:hypothetical protein
MKILGGVAPTNDKLVMSGAFNPGGYLIVSRPSPLIIADGFTFPLFTAATYGTSRFDSISLPDLGATMYWDTTKLYTNGTIVARVQTSIRETGENGFKLSSNLVQNDVQVQTGTFVGKASLQLLDAKGLKLKEALVSSNSSVQFDLTGYAPGLYFLRLRKEKGSETKQLIKTSN